MSKEQTTVIECGSNSVHPGGVTTVDGAVLPLRHIQMRQTDRELEVLFYGDVGDEFGGVTAKAFAEELKKYNNISRITVRMNSIGGSAHEGAAIYNVLKRHKAEKLFYIDGAAYSAASLVVMAGDRIFIAENAMAMIHEPWGLEMGTAADMRAHADRLVKMTGVYAETYANRSGQSQEDVMEMMKAETWMTATEAVELGFADEIVGAQRVAARAVPERMFKRTPSRLLANPDASVDRYKELLRKTVSDKKGNA